MLRPQRRRPWSGRDQSLRDECKNECERPIRLLPARGDAGVDLQGGEKRFMP
jgi:hypothetical protein